jgi:hypothetical protein
VIKLYWVSSLRLMKERSIEFMMCDISSSVSMLRSSLAPVKRIVSGGNSKKFRISEMSIQVFER